MRTEITKKNFVRMCFGIIILGVILLSVAYFILSKTLEKNELQLIGLLTTGCLVCGFGVGLSYSRTWFIEDFDDKVERRQTK